MCLCKQRNEEEGGVRDGPRLFTELIRKRVALNRHLTLSLTGEATAEHDVQPLHAFGEDECTDITGEATAAVEVKDLHAFGEDECTDITCGKSGGEKRKKETVRNERRCVAD